jgi:hypothetical protein
LKIGLEVKDLEQTVFSGGLKRILEFPKRPNCIGDLLPVTLGKIMDRGEAILLLLNAKKRQAVNELACVFRAKALNIALGKELRLPDIVDDGGSGGDFPKRIPDDVDVVDSGLVVPFGKSRCKDGHPSVYALRAHAAVRSVRRCRSSPPAGHGATEDVLDVVRRQARHDFSLGLPLIRVHYLER